MKLSVVVPCYNEKDVVEELYRRVTAVCRETGHDYELVLVNDGSKDNTWALICSLATADQHVLGISLSRNFGHQLALTAGLNMCRGNRILVMDADLQDPPELLPEMMALMDQGADVVYGQRIKREGETWLKKATAALFYRLLNMLSDIEIPVDAGDFRLISRRALDVLNAMPENLRYIRGMVIWAGFRHVPIRYERKERFAGKTKYPMAKMWRCALDAITGFSIRPLKMASTIGISFAVLGLAGFVYAMFSWLSGQTVPGWTSVIITSMFLGSAQLIVLGIIGEYLGRIFMEIKRRPLYVIDQLAGCNAGDLAAPLGSQVVGVKCSSPVGDCEAYETGSAAEAEANGDNR